ncbi:hypothetical protein TRIP_E230125 [uncultured Spirochaetota bacterium]|uniref:Uncharacterized protein n=1 Tax=uncultured Spirochaetota bacterium TaxID=460511 RepID=A0A652ZVZ6_9SPIR|nr:hypothetical protein TRIP_E230125 [uncultured Spirochaetota bacterium]
MVLRTLCLFKYSSKVYNELTNGSFLEVACEESEPADRIIGPVRSRLRDSSAACPAACERYLAQDLRGRDLPYGFRVDLDRGRGRGSDPEPSKLFC